MDQFIEHVRAECEKHGMRFYMSGKDHVEYGAIKCNGYFDHRLKTLAVADGKDPDIWHKTLAHEYGHMTQWLEQCPAWTDLFFHDNCDSETIIDLWMDGEIDLNEEQLDKHLSLARGCEVDCEWRTVELIKKYNLPIDIPNYCQRANAYMYFWSSIKYHKKWYVIGKEPYAQPEIVAAMDTELKLNDEYDDVPEHILELMKRCI